MMSSRTRRAGIHDLLTARKLEPTQLASRRRSASVLSENTQQWSTTHEPVVAFLLAGSAAATLAQEQREDGRTANPLSVFKAEHVAITTNDYQGTLDWYRRHLGFEVVTTWEIDRYPGMKFAYISSNDFAIEVIATDAFYQDELVPDNINDAIADRGISHLGFLVADVNAVYDYFVEQGEEILVEPYDSQEAQRRLFFVKDNSGNVVEFLSPLASEQQD